MAVLLAFWLMLGEWPPMAWFLPAKPAIEAEPPPWEI